MPTVPSAPLPSVGLAPIPGVRTNPDTFGASGPRVDLSEPLDEAKQRYQIAVQQANQTKVLQANEDISTGVQQITNATRAMKGTDAIHAPDYARDQLDTLRTSAMGRATNREQQLAILNLFDQHATSLNRDVDHHVSTEMEKAHAQAFEGSKASTTDQAVTSLNPENIARAIEDLKAQNEAYGKTVGLPPEVVKAQAAQDVSNLHVGVISKLFADQRDGDAVAYWDAYKKEVVGKAYPTVAGWINQGTTTVQAQKAADKILTEAGGDEDKANALVKTLEGDVRDKTQAYVTQHYVGKEAAASRKRLDTGITAVNLIEAGRPIPTNMWQAFTREQRDGLRSYQMARVSGQNVVTNYGEYYRLVELAVTDPKAFKAEGDAAWSKYLGKINRSELDRLEKMRVDIMGGDTAEVARQGQINEMSKAALAAAKLPFALSTKNPAVSEVVGQFMRKRDEAIQQWKDTHGGAAPLSDVQTIINKLVADTTITEHNKWFGMIDGKTTLPTFKARPGGAEKDTSAAETPDQRAARLNAQFPAKP